MKKIETIWHYLIEDALRHGQYRHTQQECAEKLRCSLSTVHHALKVPASIGAVRKESKFFVLQDFWKLLLYWASVRRLPRDILASARMERPVRQLEGLALPKSLFAAYTAACHHLGEPPADYDKVYFYIPEEDREAFTRRFDEGGRAPPNVFALRMSGGMEGLEHWTTLSQTFVDCWNLRDWYARDFVQALEQKMHSMLSPSP